MKINLLSICLPAGFPPDDMIVSKERIPENAGCETG
jgi:hypothetical protein